MAQRQQDRSRATRAALMSTARRLFAERGYAEVPSGDIVAAAGLTRGALYHHFGDKQGLFRAVFVQIETEMAAETRAVVAASDGFQAGVLASLGAFLAACERPEVVRIVLTDAPSVLGWSQWRAIEAEHGLEVVTGMLTEASERGLIPPGPVEVLAKLMLSATIEAALIIAHTPAERRGAVREQVQIGLLTLFAGLAVPQP